MIPGKHREPIVFAVLMSFCMSLTMTAIVTAVLTGLDRGYLGRWMHVFPIAWAVAFPAILLFGPRVRVWAARLSASE